MDKHIISSCATYYVKHDSDVLSNIDKGFETLSAAGFGGVDFNTVRLSGITEGRDAIIDGVIESAKKHGIEFAQCHLPFIPQRDGLPDGDEFNKKVFAAMDIAKAFGIKYAVMHPNTTSVSPDEYDKKAQYDRVMTFFAPFIEYANKVGVNMVVENMRSVKGEVPTYRYCMSPDELCDVADACGIGVCWDTGHANITGLCQSEALKYVGKRLKVIHLNDNNGDDDSHIAPYMGTVDWEDVMRGLKLVGYEGAINFELSTRGIPENARLDFGRYICKLGEYFKTLL